MPAQKTYRDLANYGAKTPSNRSNQAGALSSTTLAKKKPPTASAGVPGVAEVQPGVRGSTLGDIGQGIRKFVDKNIGQPLTQGVKTIKQATGLEATPINPAEQPRLDPKKIAARETQGTALEKQGQNIDMSTYGSDYFQPRTIAPQISSNQVNMPGIYSPSTPLPTVPNKVTAPDVQQISGSQPQLRDVSTGTGADTYREQNALRQEMAGKQAPLNLQQGYDPAMRDTLVANATSGLGQQKEQAMAALKEQQMKSGNFGSSVGQKQMSDLMADYDRQVIQAGQQADIMNMSASREDRYANLGAENTRSQMVGNFAGQSAGLEMGAQGYKRDTVGLQNQAALIMEDYARQGKQIDNATAMQMAEFQAGQGQQQFGNQMATANLADSRGMASYESERQRYLAGQEAGRYGDTLTNNARQFNIGQQDTADVRNYGVGQDYLNNMAAYGSNPLDPQSVLDADAIRRQREEQQARLTGTIGIAGKAISAYAGAG
jgi:hypothetical protein